MIRVQKRADSELWTASMNTELAALAEKQVYSWSDLPQGRKALPSRWVFKIKRTQTGDVDKYKARVVAKGFLQTEGVDYTEVFAPGGSLPTLRLLLSHAAANDLGVRHLDVKTAFLNGDLREEVYLQPPAGIKGPVGKVWRLHKALYGLKQAAQSWYEKLRKSLTSAGFVVSQSDPCLYIASHNSERVFLLIHVDDVLIVGCDAAVEYAKSMFCKLFEARDLGEASLFLGLQIARDRSKGVLWLGQTQYTNEVLKKYRHENCVPRVSPIDANMQLSAEGESIGDDVPFSAAIGSLLYLAVFTRPDITHAVNMLARYMSKPKQQHWNALKGVLRYLRGTSELGLLYCRNAGCIIGYSDADYAGDPVMRRSTSGYLFLNAGAAIVWGSKLQTTVAASTCEAEFIAGARAVKEALSLRKLIFDLSGKWQAVKILMDNQSALVLIKNPAAGAQNRTKHIDVAYNFARHRVQVGQIEACFVPTQKMIADIFTKQLPGPSYRMHKENLGLRKW
jgi:hypothetical protein